MTQPLLPETSPPPRLKAGKGFAGLDQRIEEIEQRIITRELGLRRRVFDLKSRVAAKQRGLMGPALIAATALVGVFLMLRSGRRHHGATTQPSAGTNSAWLRYAGLAWPLLPAKWRARVSPTTAIPLLSVLVPLIENLFTPQQPLAPLTMVSQVDPTRFQGRWFEIARLPEPFSRGCSGMFISEYEPQLQNIGDEGLPSWVVVNQCLGGHRGSNLRRGVALPIQASGGAKFKVSFLPNWLRWMPGAWAQRCILHLDDEYTEAIVGEANRNYLSVLSRTPHVAPERMDALLMRAKRDGFDISKLVYATP